MDKNKKNIVIFAIAVSLAIISIFMFSPGLFVVRTLETASAATKVIAYAVYGVFVLIDLGAIALLLKKQPDEPNPYELDTKEDLVEAFTKSSVSIFLGKEALGFRKQIFILEEKIMTLDAILQQKFEGATTSYSKFYSIVRNTEKLVYSNFKSAAMMISTFNEDDYKRFTAEKGEYPSKIMEEKMATFHTYKEEVKEMLEQNEEILLKLDKLQLEISRLTIHENIDDNPIVREMDGLISQTKLYK